MKEIFILLRPRLLSFKPRRGSPRRGLKMLFGVFGLSFWGGLFLLFFRVLRYLHAVEGFGDLLAFKLLSMILITFFFLLLFSAVLATLNHLYLSKDLPLLHSMPVFKETLYLSRWVESTFDSSWMILVYSLPVFIAYGVVYGGGAGYYLAVGLNLIPFCAIASSLSALLVLISAKVLPAGRLRNLFLFFGLMAVLLLVIVFRLIRPEQFVNPESFATLLLYLRTLETPSSPLLPTTWMWEAVRGALLGSWEEVWFNTALSWSCALSGVFLSTWIAGSLYFGGFSKSLSGRGGSPTYPSRLGRGMAILLRPLPRSVRAFAEKEVKTFFRDQSQWSQIFLILGVIVIYLYNFSVLPLEKSSLPIDSLRNVLAFLNMGLAAFVLSAISVRFVFPAVSLEREAFWIVRSSPLSIRSFLWIKVCVYGAPLLFLAEALIVISNLLLQVNPLMMTLSVITLFLVVPGIVAMGVGLGAMYADFQSESPARFATSLGGLIFMTLCSGFIAVVIVLEAGPVWRLLMAGLGWESLTLDQWAWMAGSLVCVLGLSGMATWIPIRKGERRLLEEGINPRGP
ncbi:MAG: hypothetical protein N3G78_09845 [Desulfobacterota bacterium]|nr:hypothetical protein [Thermodesulfobacteriota bacterium]